jgi:acetyl esterase/lipase
VTYLRRQLVTAALTANALRPPPGWHASVPAFAAGWLTSELAPHLLALTAADTTVQLARRDRSTAGLALAAGSMAGLGWMIRQGQLTRDCVEEALVEGLGVGYAEQLDALPTPAELATPWRRIANPFRRHDPLVRVRRDIAYTEAGRRGMLDIWSPRDGELSGAPVLLQVHGGGWTIGTKEQEGIPLMQHLASRGWVCVAINYRLSPRDAFPAHIVDVKRAIAWIRENIADHGGDPSYIAITGGSAGGHLTALAALTPGDPAFQPGFEDADTSIQACVPHYGAYDFAAETGTRATKERLRFVAKHVVGKDPVRHPEIYRAASPLARVNEDAPPFFVIHGDDDSLIPVPEARSFVDALRAVSRNPVAYAELSGAQHAFDVFPSIRTAHVVRAAERFADYVYTGYLSERDRARETLG